MYGLRPRQHFISTSVIRPCAVPKCGKACDCYEVEHDIYLCRTHRTCWSARSNRILRAIRTGVGMNKGNTGTRFNNHAY